MPWMLYKDWAGNVLNKAIRAPASAGPTVPCYGKSANPIGLRTGFTGTIVDILTESSTKPNYVKFDGKINIASAAVVRVEKAKNSNLFWQDFFKIGMSEDEYVVITSADLQKLEIEFKENEQKS